MSNEAWWAQYTNGISERMRAKTALIEQWKLREWYQTHREFELDPEQQDRFDKWRAGHKTKYTGAVGGRYEFRFLPTTVGTILTVHDHVTNEELDLSSLMTG